MNDVVTASLITGALGIVAVVITHWLASRNKNKTIKELTTKIDEKMGAFDTRNHKDTVKNSFTIINDNNLVLTKEIEFAITRMDKITSSVNEVASSVEDVATGLSGVSGVVGSFVDGRKDTVIAKINDLHEKQTQDQKRQEEFFATFKKTDMEHNVKLLSDSIDNINTLNTLLQSTISKNKLLLEKNMELGQENTTLTTENAKLLLSTEQLQANIMIFEKEHDKTRNIILENNRLSEENAELKKNIKNLEKKLKPNKTMGLSR